MLNSVNQNSQILVIVLILVLLGLFFGIIIAVLSDLLKVEEDERVDKVHKMLPGYNCGACGKSGCMGLAKAIIENDESPKLCRPIKKEQLESLEEYLQKIKNDDN